MLHVFIQTLGTKQQLKDAVSCVGIVFIKCCDVITLINKCTVYVFIYVWLKNQDPEDEDACASMKTKKKQKFKLMFVFCCNVLKWRYSFEHNALSML